MSAAPLVWVTGARGQVGRELVAALGARGVPTLATGHEADIADRGALVGALAGARPRCIFNAAAYTAVDAAESDAAAARHANAVGPARLSELARELGADLVHFSSDYVFDGEGSTPLAEDAPTAPRTVYGQSKLAGETAVLASADARHRVFVVRASWVFGPEPRSFVWRMLALMAEREELEVVDDQHGRPTAARDLAAAALALGLGDAGPGLYHFANAGATTWHGFATAIRDAALRHGLPVRTRLIRPVPTSAVPRPAPRPRWSVLDTARIERLIGPARPWLEALEGIVQDYRGARATLVAGSGAR